jgi:predicted site-specific integrase-resolvase
MFVGGKEASIKLGIHQRTLYLWEKKGKIETIRTPGNKRLYNIEKFLNQNKEINNNNCILVEKELEELEKKEEKINISYVRVSSIAQKEDLIRQKESIKEKYPNHIMIEDICSGIKLNRKGLNKIIDLAIKGKVNELVIAYKDRLTRFGYEFIEELLEKYSKAKIIIINKKDDLEPEEELVKDVLQIMNVFTAKMNGLRKYKKNKENKDEKN